ncbi:hypothetical protein [Thalassotalea litorea]|uniref:hypothetical protein n=1 Tax=Thalassotalea litorea TaxID=2020715 RepID=UPI001FEB40A8|nr:hypothetical protein [Thalassotalea litorea]
MKRLVIMQLVFAVFLYGCSTANPGIFVSSSYIANPDKAAHFLGEVQGESRQRWILYLIPMGDAPSTQQAIINAKQQISGTRFLADVSIDDRTEWGFGYSEQIIIVNAQAYR